MDTTDNLQAVIDAARQGAVAHKIASVPGAEYVLVPGIANSPSRVEKIALEYSYTTPIRKRGTVQVFDAASLNAVIAANSDAGNIAVYVNRDPNKPTVVAVLNGHGKSGPGWGDFRAEIAFRPTPQWVKWTGIDGKMMPQATFAEFIEDNMSDISDPPGAELLEIVTYMQATRNVDFKSAMQLSSGAVQFQNLESLDTKVGAGSIAMPTVLTLGIAPLFGLPHFKVPTRLRYRLTEGKLTLGVKLQRVEDLMADVIGFVVETIVVGDNVSIFEGLAPAAIT